MRYENNKSEILTDTVIKARIRGKENLKSKENKREKIRNEEKERRKGSRQHHLVKVEGRRHTGIYLRHEIFPIVRAVGKVYGLLLTMGL